MEFSKLYHRQPARINLQTGSLGYKKTAETPRVSFVEFGKDSRDVSFSYYNLVLVPLR